MTDNFDYASDVNIDPESLDTEWIEQPTKLWKYAKIAATKRKEADLAKEKIEYVKAEIDKKIRTNPDKYGIERVTEPAVERAIVLSTEFKEASQEYIDAKFEMEVARAAVQAIEQRKDALENLVNLHRQQYFAGPSVPRDLSYEWQKRNKDKNNDEKIAESMKLKRVKK